MDLIKAQRLLNKIQAFLDNGNGHELSRLEKDLIKSYVQQLYDAVTLEDVHAQDSNKQTDTSTHKTHRIEPLLNVETPVVHPVEPPKTETFKPSYTEYIPPVIKPELEIYSDYSSSGTKEKDVEPEAPKPETKSTPVHETKLFDFKTTEPIKEDVPIYKPHVFDSGHDEELNKLFDLQKSDEGSRFSHVPIASIESAMGLNERIFTLNELFGGDKGLFDAWCTKLNSLTSFAEAKNVLMSGPAKDFKWADPERIKMAEQFIRIVSRRYPKSAT
ncbi:MAG TPA: hypothetical protein VMZ69_00795 [Saprospiraceae bacterium]|nr:hypothetical protein [Saprospiraceae bacterium]